MTRKLFTYFLVLIVVMQMLTVPLFAVHAQSSDGGDPGGLVPCGKELVDKTFKQNNPNGPGLIDVTIQELKNPCDFADLMIGLQRIIKFFFVVSVPITIIVVAWAGIKYLTAGGDTGKIGDAKKMFVPVFLGFLFIFTAWLIVSLLVKSFAKDAVGDNIINTYLKNTPR
ncbi:MAG TPA: pilin [Candidatus Paceibacterota bacterium]